MFRVRSRYIVNWGGKKVDDKIYCEYSECLVIIFYLWWKGFLMGLM